MTKVVRYRDLWKQNRNFRNFFRGQLVSFLGDWFTTIALYSSVAELSSSAVALTLVLVCKTLPVFLIAPFAGPLVDRLDRRKVLLFADVGRAFFALVYVGIHQFGSLPGLYICATASTLLSGIAIPAKQAILPRIVSAESYAAANAMGGASWAAMLAIGAALGGSVTALVGIDMSFVIDSATFLLSAFFFFRLPPQPPPKEEGDKARFSDALRYLGENRILIAQASMKTCQALAGGVFAMIPIFGGTLFVGHQGALWLGLLYALRGVGTLVGTLWLRIWIGDSPSAMRLWMIFAFTGQVLVYYFLSQSENYWQACTWYFFSGLLQGMVWVFAGTLLQAAVEPRFHGRVFALDFGGLTLTLALSSVAAGYGVDMGMDPREVVGMMAPLPLIGVALSALVWKVRRKA